MAFANINYEFFSLIYNMKVFHLPNFTVDLNSADNDIKKLMQTAKPEWNEDEIQVKNLYGGFSCGTFKVGLKNQQKNNLIVRVRRLFAEPSLILNPVLENKVVQALAKRKLFSKVYVIFKNGYCYQFLDGKPLLNVTALEESIPIQDYPFKQIASVLAEIHSEKLPGEDFSKDTKFETIEKVLKTEYPNAPNLPAKAELEVELDELRKLNTKFKQNIVLCHGDLHAGNIIWDRNKEITTFIDWEGTHIGYPAHDIAYFLSILDSDEILPTAPVPKIETEKIEGIKKQFIPYYLEKWFELNPKDAPFVNDETVEKFYKEVRFFDLVSYICLVVILGAVMGKKEDKISEDLPNTLFEIIYGYYNAYKNNKEKILKLVKLS